jgi:ApbE superfamily uncharacterized protein (UPF0280 family)
MQQDARDYRYGLHSDLQLSRLVVGETDLAVSLPPAVWTPQLEKGLRDHLIRERSLLQQYITRYPAFAASHQPLTPTANAPPLARAMMRAAAMAGVGPMAAVAGAFAASAGKYLAAFSREMVVENGGDIYLAGESERVIGVYAGEHSPFSGNLGVVLSPSQLPCGVCTSSGTVGRSFSYGVADAALVIAADALLADAMATAAANLVHGPADVEAACKFALAHTGISAALILCQDAMAVAGNIELTSIR